MNEPVEGQKSEGTFWKETVKGSKSKFWRKVVISMSHMQVVGLWSPESRSLTTKFFQVQ